MSHDDDLQNDSLLTNMIDEQYEINTKKLHMCKIELLPADDQKYERRRFERERRTHQEVASIVVGAPMSVGNSGGAR